jgi:predicted nucleotidyltransferase
MNSAVANSIDQIKELCAKYDVQSLYLFGSASTGVDTEQSDIDILVEFKVLSFEDYTDRYFSLHYALEDLLGKQIDLVTTNSLSNPYFIKSIEETKHLLYAA